MTNVRTMKPIGVDFWSMPVYRCIETNILYKDLSLGSETPDLYSCSNDFEGEPVSPIKKSLEIHFIKEEKQPTEEEKFTYMMLGRLITDCEYYLGNNKQTNLWGITVEGHIKEMKRLYESLPKDGKPEWLTWEQILQYEKLML